MSIAPAALEILPPSSLDAEQAVIGALLLDRDALVKVGAPPLALNADDFFRDAHRAIYAAMLDLWRRAEPQDIVTVTDELERRGQLLGAGGVAYIHSLATVVPTAIHVEHYARIVQRTALRRRLISVAGRIAGLGYDDSTEVEAAVAEAVTLTMALGDRQTARGGHVRDILARLDVEPSPNPIGCHIPTLRNELNGGFRPEQLYMWAGAPSAYKTALMVDLALHAIHDGAGVIHISLENSDTEILNRYLGNLGRIGSRAMDSRKFSDTERENLDYARNLMELMPLYVYDANSVRQPADIAMLTALAKARHPDVPRWLAIVDYVQLLEVSHQRQSQIDAIDSNVRQLQRLAVTQQVALLAVSSLDKESWTGDPKNWSGRGSSTPKGEAMFFGCLVPDEEANRTSIPRDGIAYVTIIVTKNRRGLGSFHVPCRIEAPTGKWQELAQGAYA